MKNHITLKQKIVEILAYVLMWASIVIGIIWVCKAAEGSGNTL